MKIFTNELGYVTNMSAMPIYGKNHKILLLQNQKTDDLETLYVALSMQVLPRFFKLLTWVDSDTFYAKVKFGDIGFVWEKVKIIYFLGNYCSLRSQSCLKHSTK